MLNIILFGPPGAGKGTQSQQLKEKYNLTYLSTGDILREEMAAETEIGKKVKDIISKGGLVSDEIVVSIIRGRVEANQKSAGFLFDGFPRTVRQAEMLDGIMNEFSLKINAVLSLEVPEEILINRMIERGKTSGRADDNIDSIKHRFVEYNEKTKPVLAYYEKQGNLKGIDGVGKVEDIFATLCNEIDKISKK
ncbi:MAG: adenylate kinase [Bacteroidia bacterium]|nr:adenylate kinase [Bacteroidia bacterium]